MPLFSFRSSLLKFLPMSTSAIHTATGSHYSSYKWSASVGISLAIGCGSEWAVRRGRSGGTFCIPRHSVRRGADIRLSRPAGRPVTLPLTGRWRALASRLRVEFSCRWVTDISGDILRLRADIRCRFRTRYLLHVHENEKGGVLCKFARWKSRCDGPLSIWQYKAWEKFDGWYRFRGKCRYSIRYEWISGCEGSCPVRLFHPPTEKRKISPDWQPDPLANLYSLALSCFTLPCLSRRKSPLQITHWFLNPTFSAISPLMTFLSIREDK